MDFFYESRHGENLIFKSKNLDFEAHLHEYIELGYVESGESDLYIDGKCFKLKSGDVFVVFPNQIHRYENSKNICADVLIFPPEIIAELKDVLSNSVPESPVADGDLELGKQLIKLLAENTDSLSDESVRGLILSICGIVFKKLKLKSQEKYDISTLKSILIYCNEHFSEPITINDAARDLCISKSHISHLLKNKVGTYFGKYVKTKRIDLACRMLLKTNMSVTDIAFSCGFSSVRSFNRVFAEIKSCTPIEYRKTSK